MYGYTTAYAYFRPDRAGHTGIYVGDGYVVEALGWGQVKHFLNC